MFHTAKGTPYPMGCTYQEHEGKRGFNFSLYSSQARAVELCFFDSTGQEVRFPMYKTEDVWHIWLANLEYGTEYGFRIYGNSESISNLNKLMLDPYAKAVNGKPDLSNREKRKWFLLSDDRDNAAFAPKSVITQTDFDWEGDKPLRTPWAETIIYEVHVKGFTQLHLDLPEEIRGSYAGLAYPKMIAYLKELGITAVELLPINYHLDEPHLQEKGLQNYWGYSPLAMFAVESKYWSGQEGTTPLTEFKSMVKALHQAGIEVILDVVFNHSVESEKHFPTFCQRGIDDRAYYWQNEDGEYHNYTGCGNSLNLYHDASRCWVLDCLRYWVEECHVDGFRFDLASTLGREPDFNKQALLFREIEQEPCLKHCKLIAEPWDIGGNGYQVGNFPTYFAEWNDRFRDDVTKFWLWKSGELGVFTERFAGSSDIYKYDGRLPHHSINFITAHDGFTLRDLVSYNHKHNEANGENNRDGRNENYSYNHGFEGIENVPPMVEQDRILSRASLMMSLLLANGTPMLLAGDEFGHTQFGNNNAYCQDNETSWLKWAQFDTVFFNFIKQTIALRKKIRSLNHDQWWSIENVQLFNTQGELMNLDDWHNRDTKAMQILLDHQYLLLINAKTELQTFILPKGRWKIVEDAAFNQNQRWENGFLTLESVDFCVLQK
ncbi:glycogen debranching protein GlgX [Actinobacillus minor]|uniref:glycogen debranching protein GlgX n=1 Tax=Actinobacillus minor TaxID=51047 RepID=UPI0026ED9259|nr:glycogen debranching protein GlgX [Actinobacillus minor]